MASILDGKRRSLSSVAGIYLAVLIVALGIVAIGTTIWLTTDNNAGPNVLATDEQSVTRVP